MSRSNAKPGERYKMKLMFRVNFHIIIAIIMVYSMQKRPLDKSYLLEFPYKTFNDEKLQQTRAKMCGWPEKMKCYWHDFSRKVEKLPSIIENIYLNWKFIHWFGRICLPIYRHCIKNTRVHVYRVPCTVYILLFDWLVCC